MTWDSPLKKITLSELTKNGLDLEKKVREREPQRQCSTYNHHTTYLPVTGIFYDWTIKEAGQQQHSNWDDIHSYLLRAEQREATQLPPRQELCGFCCRNSKIHYVPSIWKEQEANLIIQQEKNPQWMSSRQKTKSQQLVLSRNEGTQGIAAIESKNKETEVRHCKDKTTPLGNMKWWKMSVAECQAFILLVMDVRLQSNNIYKPGDYQQVC